MAMRQPSGDVDAASPLMTPRSDNAGSVEDVIAGLVDLDAKGLRLQWRNHLGEPLPPICRVGCSSGSSRMSSRSPHSAVPTKRRCVSSANRKVELSAPLETVPLKPASHRRGRGSISERARYWSVSGRASCKG